MLLLKIYFLLYGCTLGGVKVQPNARRRGFQAVSVRRFGALLEGLRRPSERPFFEGGCTLGRFQTEEDHEKGLFQLMAVSLFKYEDYQILVGCTLVVLSSF